MRKNTRTASRYLLVFVSIFSVTGTPALGRADEAVNYEGLSDVKVSTLDVAQIRPDVLFSVYTGVMLDDVEVAFRTPDRSQRQFPLDAEQKTRFQEALARRWPRMADWYPGGRKSTSSVRAGRRQRERVLSL